MRKLERVSFCIELKFLNGKCTFVQRERNSSGRRYTLVFSMIYDSASVFTERRIQDIVTMNNFTGPFFSFFFISGCFCFTTVHDVCFVSDLCYSSSNVITVLVHLCEALSHKVLFQTSSELTPSLLGVTNL